MLAFKANSGWVQWTNQPRPLNDEGSFTLSPNAEALLTDAELAAYGLHRIVDAAPVPEGYRIVSTALDDDSGAPRWVHVTEATPLTEVQAAKTAAVNAAAEILLVAGAPVAGSDGQTYHLALDDGSRADITAMGATALAVMQGAAPWPESYARGWITLENVRVPLPAASDGLLLATAAGIRYAQIVQRRRDLKDAIAAAPDQAALDAIDITAGWPA